MIDPCHPRRNSLKKELKTLVQIATVIRERLIQSSCEFRVASPFRDRLLGERGQMVNDAVNQLIADFAHCLPVRIEWRPSWRLRLAILS